MYNNLTFVNKTAKNLNKRSPQESRAINEHINGTYARWNRDQKSSSGESASGKSRSRHADDDESPEGSHESPPSTGSPAKRSRHTTPTTPSPTEGYQKSPTTVTSLTSDDIGAIKFATDFHMHALGFTDIAGVSGAGQLWNKWWLGKRQETHRLESQLALLAWAYSSMTFVHSSSNRDRVVKGLEFRGAALQQLQRLMQSLKGHADYATALDCTLYLGCVEWQHGLVNETMAHFKAAKSFLDTLGGLKALPPQSQETILWIFNNASFTFPVRPLVGGDEGLRGSRHETEGIDSLSRMSLDEDRSSSSTVDQLIGSQLASLLAKTNEVIEKTGALPNSSAASNDKIKRFHDLYMRKLSLEISCGHLWHDMLEATPVSARDQGRHTKPATSSFRLTFCLLLRIFQKTTLNTFTAMIPWKKYFLAWHDTILDRVRPIQCDIQARSRSDGKSNREQKAKELVLLWMLFTGACVEQMFLTAGARDLSSNDRTIYCSSQFTVLAGQMGYKRANDVAADFDKYIAFCGSKQGQILKKLMQPLEPRVEQKRR